MKIFRLKYALPIAFFGFVYVGYVLYPLAATLRESLLVNGEFSVTHYLNLLDPTHSSNAEAVWNSVFVSLLSVFFSAAVGTFLAFVFTQCNVPFRNIFSRLAIMPIALPPLVGVIAFLFVFGESGILPRLFAMAISANTPSAFALDGFSAIVAVHTYSFYVYFYLFVSTALRNIDASQLEAAQALGSSTTRTLRQIIFPEIKPALIGASILTFMASMASFSAPLLFGGERRFMTLQIFNAKLNGDLNVASAYAIGLTLVSICFFVVLRVLNPDSSSRKSKGVARSGVLRLSKRVRSVLVGVAFVILAVELVPIITILLISFAQEGSWTWQLLPTAYTTENYFKLFNDAHVFDPIVNSVLMSCVAVAAASVFGVAIAYLVTKGGLSRSRLLVDVLATLPFAIPGTVIAVSLILAFNAPTIFTAQQVLVGTFWILPLAYFIRMFPFVVRSTSASLQQLDDSLLEAGKTFGAGALRRFWKITLPMILPGIISGALLVMITALGEFVSSVLLYTYANRPISVEILAQMRGYNFGAAAAYAVLLLVLILCITFASNYLVREDQANPPSFNI